MAAYRTVEINRFGGLDVRRDPQDASPVRALDILNVDLAQDGRIRRRPGMTKVVSQSTTTEWQSLVAFRRAGSLSPYLITIVPSSGQLRAYNASTGGLITTHAPTAPSLPARIMGAAMMGTAADDNVMYLTVSGSSARVKFDGSAFSNLATLGTAEHLAVQYPDNRLALANFGTADNLSRVYFSDANDPESITIANYVDLMPGDGEEIIGLENFRDFLIAFKESAFYVFYGNSTDSLGEPVFNYRTVRHNLMAPTLPTKVTASGREGVYFVTRDGVYVTDGGFPRKVSQQLDPLFTGSDNAGHFTAVEEIPSLSNITLVYAGGKLYMNVESSSTLQDGLFVYDPTIQQWTYWQMLSGRSMNIQGMAAGYTTAFPEEVPYFLAVGGSSPNIRSVISRLDSAQLNDQDHAVDAGYNAYYQTNYMDLGDPGSEKVIREIQVEGQLTAKHVGLYTDNVRVGSSTTAFGSVTTATADGVSATWPEYRVGTGRHRYAVKGRNFSFAVGAPSLATNASWVLHRVLLNMRNDRRAGVES